MIADIRQFFRGGPFEPFFSADHASVNPQGSRVVVWFEHDSSATVSDLHIAAVEKDT